MGAPGSTVRSLQLDCVGVRGIYDDDLHQDSGAATVDDLGNGVTYTFVMEAADELASEHVVCD